MCLEIALAKLDIMDVHNCVPVYYLNEMQLQGMDLERMDGDKLLKSSPSSFFQLQIILPQLLLLQPPKICFKGEITQ